MSDYWVSRKKYFCRYCEIYISDDVPSRQQHEGGLRHKGNKERFVRGLYKQGEKRKKDLEEEKREIAAIEQAANAAFARDISTGHASSSSSKLTSVAGPAQSIAKKPERPTSKFANYSTAQSLGYTDPDADLLAAETARRQTQGVVGEWQIVVPHTPPEGQQSTASDVLETVPGPSRKRDADVDDEDSLFRVRKKKLAVGLGEDWDPIDIPIKLKSDQVKEEPKLGTDALPLLKGEEDAQSQPSAAPKWTAKGWKRAVEQTGAADDDANLGSNIFASVITSLTPDPSDQSPSAASKPPSLAAVSATHDAPTLKQEVGDGISISSNTEKTSCSIREEGQSAVSEHDVKGESDVSGWDSEIPKPAFRKRKLLSAQIAKARGRP